MFSFVFFVIVTDLTIHETALYSHLIEILCFFVRHHLFRNKYFILSENLASRVAQLLESPEKHLKLSMIYIVPSALCDGFILIYASF